MPKFGSEAEDTVFGNLGLEPKDLTEQTQGGEQDQDTDNDTDNDTEQGQDREQSLNQQDDDDTAANDRGEQRQPLNNLRPQNRVSHTDDTRPLHSATQLKTDKRGNILDAQGNIVARSGKEARLFTQLHNTRGEVAQIRETAGEYKRRLDRAVEIANDINGKYEQLQREKQELHSHGLTPQDMGIAAQSYAEYRRDPISFAKKLLTQLAADGKDMTSLGMQPGGFDPASLMQMIKTTLAEQTKPLRERSERETQDAQRQEQDRVAQQRTEDEVREFFNDPANRGARQYADVFLKAYQNPVTAKMSLGEIWARIQLNLERNKGNSQQRSNGQRQPRLPNGRNSGGPLANEQRNRPEMAPIESSYDDVIKGVLAQYGT